MSPKTGHIPVLLCTGAVRRVQELQGHLLDMDVAVVLKPFNIDDLLQAVARGLKVAPEPRASDEAST